MNFSLPKFLSKSKRTPRTSKPAVKVAPAPVMAGDPIPLPGNLRQRLNNLRSRLQVVGISTGVAMLLSALSLLFLAQAVSDWWFDLPWIARAGFLLADIAVLGSIYRRHLDGALRKRLGLAETALLVEKKWPQLKQSIIAAVELSEGKGYSTRGSRQLVDVMLEQARARTMNLNFCDVVSLRALRRWMILGGAAILGTGAVTVVAWPASLALVERIFLLNVPLPTKTIVIPITRDLMVPVGSDVEISARAQGMIPTHGRVTVTYAAGAPQEFPVTALPDKPDTFSFTLHNVQTAFKYSFSLNDGHGPEFTVTAKVPPSVTSVECEQIYPDYTGVPPRKLSPTELSLLAGSHLNIKAVSTDPLKSAEVVLQGVTQTIPATLDAAGTQLEATIPIPAKDLTGFSIHLVDQAGVSSANETVYPITLVPDNPPVVKILEPADDNETITLRAKPVIAFEAGDDYGLAQLTINYQLIPPMMAGETDARPPSDVQSIPIKIKPAVEGKHYEYVLDVGAQTPAWQEGYTVNYWVEATDNNTATGPGVTKTEHKQFGVISVEAKQAEILERLKQNAAEIDTLSDTQQKINNDVGEAIPQK
jgi:uncharacterized protein DUF4175